MEKIERLNLISVIGAGGADEAILNEAREVGALLAERGLGLVTGGMAGVMLAASKGAASKGGLTVGILPTDNPAHANPYIKIAIPTGMGQARNILVVLAGMGAIAISGGAGTLSEIGHALKAGRPVVSLHSHEPKGAHRAETPQEAVDKMLKLLGIG